LLIEYLTSLYFRHISHRLEKMAADDEIPFDWVWDHSQAGFLDWLQHGTGLFWICGKAGSGKSTLMNYLVREERTVREHDIGKSTGSIVIAHFFDSTAGPLESSKEGFLRACIYQILHKVPRTYEAVQLLDKKSLKPCKTLDLSNDSLEVALNSILFSAYCPRIFCLVDAADECTGSHTEFAKFLLSLSLKKPDRIKICVSSRPDGDFSNIFKQKKCLVLEKYTAANIDMYVRNECSDILKSGKKEYIDFVDTIIAKSSGVFLWAKLMAAEFCRSYGRGEDIAPLKERLLSNIPDKLQGIYKHILENIEDLERDEVIQILLISSAGARSFYVAELGLLLNYLENRPKYSSSEDFKRRIEAICRGLVEVQQVLDSSNFTVHIAHETLFAFLRTPMGQTALLGSNTTTSNKALALPSGHKLIIEASLYYTFAESVRDIKSPGTSKRFELLQKRKVIVIRPDPNDYFLNVNEDGIEVEEYEESEFSILEHSFVKNSAYSQLRNYSARIFVEHETWKREEASFTFSLHEYITKHAWYHAKCLEEEISTTSRIWMFLQYFAAARMYQWDWIRYWIIQRVVATPGIKVIAFPRSIGVEIFSLLLSLLLSYLLGAFCWDLCRTVFHFQLPRNPPNIQKGLICMLYELSDIRKGLIWLLWRVLTDCALFGCLVVIYHYVRNRNNWVYELKMTFWRMSRGYRGLRSCLIVIEILRIGLYGVYYFLSHLLSYFVSAALRTWRFGIGFAIFRLVFLSCSIHCY
jgi:hypothetical protein